MLRLAALLLLLLTVSLPAEERMDVVWLRVTPAGVTLLGTTNVSGHAKAAPDAPEGIGYQLTTTDGAPVGRGVVRDPLVRRFCLPDEHGELRTTLVASTNELVELRIPAEVRAKRIRFSRHKASTPGQRVGNAAPQDLGEVVLP